LRELLGVHERALEIDDGSGPMAAEYLVAVGCKAG